MIKRYWKVSTNMCYLAGALPPVRMVASPASVLTAAPPQEADQEAGQGAGAPRSSGSAATAPPPPSTGTEPRPPALTAPSPSVTRTTAEHRIPDYVMTILFLFGLILYNLEFEKIYILNYFYSSLQLPFYASYCNLEFSLHISKC